MSKDQTTELQDVIVALREELEKMTQHKINLESALHQARDEATSLRYKDLLPITAVRDAIKLAFLSMLKKDELQGDILIAIDKGFSRLKPRVILRFLGKAIDENKIKSEGGNDGR